MRRFEFVEGTSAKFWSGWVEDANFVVEYGRIGTAGQRKAKPFADAAAAQRECDKKIAEKLREGYHEVTSGEGAAPVAAKPKLVLPPRVRGVPAGGPSPARIDAAVKALAALEGDVGGRSWSVAHRGRVARRALEALGGVDPAKVPALARGFDAVLALVTGAKGGRRLPLRIALELLSEVHVAAFERALAAWQKAPTDAPARAAIEAIAGEAQALGESELALRFGALVADNASNDAGWSKRWKALAPHIEAALADKGSSVAEHAKALAASGDARVARRGAMLA